MNNIIRKNFYLIFFIFSFLILSAYNIYKGFPNLKVTDDFSYMLAADTFAHGRITNPPHQYWQFFENAHILSTPSYMSKYQPGYGAVLALGKILFSEPFYGVLIATALFAVCFVWMANSLLPGKWAFAGGIFVLVYFGFCGYWGRSFFGGGSLSAAAACLVLGAYFYGRNKNMLPMPVQFCIGSAILFFTRPYEGGALVLAICLCTALDIYKKVIFLKKCKGFFLVAVISGLLVVSFQLYYNFKITGNYMVMPYQEQIKQYMTARYFWFNEAKIPERIPEVQLLNKLYSVWEMVEFSKFDQMGLTDKIYYSYKAIFFTLLPYSHLFILAMFFYFFYLGPDPEDNRLILIILLCSVLSAIVTWKADHYLFALIVCSIVFILKIFSRLTYKMKNDEEITGFLRKHRILMSIIFVSTIIIPLIHLAVMAPKKSGGDHEKDKYMIINWVSGKDKITQGLEKISPKNLVFVKYKDYKKSDEQGLLKQPGLYNATIGFVYNKNADIDSNDTIYAHYLGKEENKELINYYKDRGDNRKIWLLDITDIQAPYKLLPYKINEKS